ncbi:MAG: hypothetical protein GDA50_02000 [Alphaproteobacteria bacterium GM202ARS2]|nr:hypothetical protein [Alphaproteobacteria bacterium GM202ARS2]
MPTPSDADPRLTQAKVKVEKKAVNFHCKKGFWFWFIVICRGVLVFLTALTISLPLWDLIPAINKLSLSEDMIQLDYAVFLIIAFSLTEGASYRKRHEFARLEITKIQEMHIQAVKALMRGEVYKNTSDPTMRLELLKYHLENIKEIRRDARKPLELKFMPISVA